MISITGLNADRSLRTSRRAGFTLLELVLVTLIIGTTLAMAAPSLRGFFASRQTADTAAQIVALAECARTQAAVEARVYRLNLDSRNGLFWLTVQTGEGFESLDTKFGRVFQLPEGIAVEWDAPTRADDATWIAFYPDGRTTPVEIRLSPINGECILIRCLSPSERLHVVAAHEEGSL